MPPGREAVCPWEGGCIDKSLYPLNVSLRFTVFASRAVNDKQLMHKHLRWRGMEHKKCSFYVLRETTIVVKG